MTKNLRHLYIFLFCAMTYFCFAQTSYEVRQYSISDGLPSNLISCIEQDNRGLIWVGTWSGMCCFDGYEFMPCNGVGDPQESPQCSRVFLIRFDKNDNVWCLTYDRRVYLFNTSTCQWTDVSKILEKKFNVTFHVWDIYPLDSGVLWLQCYADENLAFRIQNVDDIYSATNEFQRMEEPRNKRERELWALNKTQKPDVSHVPGMESARKYLVDFQKNIWHIDHQLTRHTPREQRFIITNNTPKRNTRTIPAQPDIDGHQVYATLTDSKGRHWKGTKGTGLYLDGKNQEINGHDVFDIFEDSQGHIWVACYDKGINLLFDGKFVNTDNRLTNYPKELYAKVRHITETRDGVIFLSTSDGIVCFNSKFDKPEDIKFHTYSQNRDKEGSLPEENVMQILQTSSEKIYISTMNGGLITVKSGNPLNDDLSFEPVSETQSTKGIVLCMIEDSDGCLWLARENYLEKFNPKTSETVFFEKKDFGQEISFSEALPKLDATTGKITFGTYGGTLSFNPKHLVKSCFIPHILFSSVQFQGSQERQPILYIKELDVPANRRNLTIFFSALDYQDNELIQYAYKIVGEDYDLESDNGEDWNYVGRAHCASFNNLPCGHLRLLVKSTNADGIWGDNIAELSIYSHPTFWETPWAWLLYAVLVLVIVFVAIYIVQMRNRHRREREEMERKLEVLLQNLDDAKKEHENTQQEENGGKIFTLPEVEIEPEEKKLMEKLIAFLDENISNSNLKINDLADAINMSRSVFYARLKAITGMSPVDFLRYLRIQRAKQMIATTDLSISQVAYETGFSDPTYFTKVFKKSTGQSPLTYRKSQRDASQD